MISKAARRHLLKLYTAATRPLAVFTKPKTPALSSPSLWHHLAGLMRGSVLFVGPTIEIQAPSLGRPRVVAGKGSRKRGVRGRVKLATVKPAAERRVPIGIALEDAAKGQPVKVLVTMGVGGWR